MKMCRRRRRNEASEKSLVTNDADEDVHNSKISLIENGKTKQGAGVKTII